MGVPPPETLRAAVRASCLRPGARVPTWPLTSGPPGRGRLPGKGAIAGASGERRPGQRRRTASVSPSDFACSADASRLRGRWPLYERSDHTAKYHLFVRPEAIQRAFEFRPDKHVCSSENALKENRWHARAGPGTRSESRWSSGDDDQFSAGREARPCKASGVFGRRPVRDRGRRSRARCPHQVDLAGPSPSL